MVIYVVLHIGQSVVLSLAIYISVTNTWQLFYTSFSSWGLVGYHTYPHPTFVSTHGWGEFPAVSRGLVDFH